MFFAFGHHVVGISFISFNSRSLILACRDGCIMAVDVVGHSVFRVLRISYPCAVVCLSFSLRSELVFTGLDMYSGIFTWNLCSLQLVFIFRDHLSPVTCISFDMWRLSLASGG